jgi:hypothetical protein
VRRKHRVPQNEHAACLNREGSLKQQTIHAINFGIFHHMSWNVEARKNLKYFIEKHQQWSGEMFSEKFVVLIKWFKKNLTENKC